MRRPGREGIGSVPCKPHPQLYALGGVRTSGWHFIYFCSQVNHNANRKRVPRKDGRTTCGTVRKTKLLLEGGEPMTQKTRISKISTDSHPRSKYYNKGIDGYAWVHDHAFNEEYSMKSKVRDHKKYKPLF